MAAPGFALLALLAWGVVAAGVHPSWRAIDWYAHVAGAAAIALGIARLTAGQLRVVLSAVAGLAAIQGLFGVAQSLNGDPFGWELVEYSAELYDFGGRYAGKGSFGHPYHLASFLLVGVAAAFVLWTQTAGARRTWASVLLLALALSVPFTYSRASLAGLVPIVLIGLVAKRGKFRRATVFLLAGLVIGVTVTSQGWSEKASNSVDLEQADSGRRQRIEEAWSLVEDDPVFGVGPGRYVLELSAERGVVSHPAHNPVFHAGGEMGVPGLVLAAVLLGAVGWWALTGGALAAIAWLTLLPLQLLDAFPYSFAQGLVVTGFWVGIIVVARRPAGD